MRQIGISVKMGMFDLRGLTAVVTGASRGLGMAIALGLAEAGADIVALARRTGDVATLKRMIENLERRCLPVQVDMRSVDAIRQAFDCIAAEGMSPQILVNNAGVEELCSSAELEESVWDTIMDTNLKGSFFASQCFARPLLDTGKSGSIINLGSLTSAVGVATAVPYTSSKSGLLGMTRALSTEWSPHGIRVNAIGPGYFRTAMTDVFFADSEWRDRMRSRIPIGRFGRPDDLKGVTVFLAGKASSYVTGQILYVDGGYLASL